MKVPHMPLYEYECQSCHSHHEFMQKFSDEPMSTCPSCQGPLKKLMSLASFSLKGSGWYSTDYKKTAAKSESKHPPCASSCCSAKTG